MNYTWLAALLAAAGWGLGASRAGAHMTPVVVLHRRAEVIRASLPGARHYFERRVDVGREDAQKLEQVAQLKLDAPQVDFYYGVDPGGQVVGAVVFVPVDTRHGPLEVGVGMDAGGAVRQVMVSRTTIETRPWVEAMIRAGVLAHFQGLHFGDDPLLVLPGASIEKLGAMPAYFARATARAVKRGLALYGILYEAPEQP